MEFHICARCGEMLRKGGSGYDCPYCSAHYDDDEEERSAKRLSAILDEEKAKKLSDALSVLYKATHASNPSSVQVRMAAHDVLLISPEDPLGNFYAASESEDPSVLSEYLRNSVLAAPLAEEVFRYSLRSLSEAHILPLKAFLARHYEGQALFEKESELEEEAGKVHEGLYLPGVPRDVFLAYSSSDADIAERLVKTLEQNGFTVFIASRNLRHGKGAVENYRAALEEAMEACKVLVFLSSRSSRSLSCDAMKVELTYIHSHRPNMPRIEFVLDDEKSYAETAFLAKKFLKEFFDGLEWCRHEEDLIERVYKHVNEEAEEKKAPVSSINETRAEPSFYPSFREGDFMIEDEIATHYYGGEVAVVPPGVKVIRRGCFGVFPKSLTLPSSLEHIEQGAFPVGYPLFSGAPDYKDTDISIEIRYYGTIDSWLALTGKMNLPRSHTHLHIKSDGGEALRIKIPERVSSLPPFAFFNCDSLASVYIPRNVISIGDCPLFGCERIERLYLGKIAGEALERYFAPYQYGERVKPIEYLRSTGFNLYLPHEFRFVAVISGEIATSRYFERCGNLTICLGHRVSSVSKDSFYDCYASLRIGRARKLLKSPEGFEKGWDKDFQGKIGYEGDFFDPEPSEDSFDELA